MSPTDFGWFGIVTTAIALASLLGSLGLRQSFGYEIGQKHRTPGEAAGTALALWMPLALASAVVVYLLYGRQLPGVSAGQAAALIAVGVAALLLIILMQGIFLGIGNIRVYALSETAPRVALMLFVIMLIPTAGVALESALWAYNGGLAVAAIIVFFLAVRGAGRLRANFRQLGRTLRFGMTNALNLLLVTFNASISIFVIEHFSDAGAAGQFFAATRVNEIVLEAATVVGMVLFSNAARQDQTASVLHRNARIGCGMFWLFMALGGIVALFSPLVMKTLAGSEYAAAGPALQILALGLAPTAASKVIYQTLAGSGQPRFGTPIIVASLAMNAMLAFTLIPSMGINGGALAFVLGQYLLFAGYVVSCHLRYEIPVRDLLIPRSQDIKRSWRIISSRVSR